MILENFEKIDVVPYRVIIVLGMHRSGTSATTRALQVLGVSFGENLMPPVAGDNEKGYFEDVEINALNIEMLQAIGSEWFYLESVELTDVQFLRERGYVLRAVELLRRKMESANIFAFKDPRVAKLLPFWNQVTDHLQFNVNFVMALRHPLSVVRSLEKRGNFIPERSYLLWLGHVLESLRGSAGKPRVLVDYDRLIQSPDIELSRIADAFHLEINSVELEEYKNNFLDSKLRHTVYSPDDLLLDAACPAIVHEVFTKLLDVASGHLSLDDPTLVSEIAKWITEFDRLKSILNLADKQHKQIAALGQAVAEREGQIATLGQAVAEREGQIATLGQAVAEREGQIATLGQAVAERDGQIATLAQAVAERDGQIATLSQNVAERDQQLTHLAQTLAAKDAQIAALYNSASWRVMAPVRWAAQPLINVGTTARAIGSVLQRNGGLLPTARLAHRVLKQQGLPALLYAARTAVKPQKMQHAGLVALPSYTDSVSGNAPAQHAVVPDRNDYTEWVRRYDTLTDAGRQRMRDAQAAFAAQPLISVVMPTYNPKPEWLVEAIESVRAQIYPHWELCIADDASTNPAIRPILERYTARDQRIKVVFRQNNGHISAASNSAIELATGEWIALLDHDDLLSENALFWVAETINRAPNARLIYSDEDKITENGRRSDPYFKCDWNPDLFYSHNMICHLGVYHASIVKEIGGFRQGFEGSQDYDLALRCIARIKPAQIIHVPRVLYHWRVHMDSTAMSGDSKPYAALAGERAINEHFAKTGVNGRVKYVGYGYEPEYDLPENLPLVSIIIPTRNGKALLKQCVDSIFEKTSYKNYEILIIDNGSDESDALVYFDQLSKRENIRIVRDDSPFNYSRLNNKAVELAQGELVALVNNDIEVISGHWLTVMVAHALRPGVGAVGAKLWYTNKALQHGGVILGLGGVAGHSHKHTPAGAAGYCSRLLITQSLSAVTAACLVIKKSTFNEVGGLEEKRLQIAFNDIDFCLRVREAGYRNIWTPLAELFHHESASRGHEDTPEKQARFAGEVAYMKKRWGAQLLNDPAYSPNLTTDHEDFSYSWPPRIFSYV